MNTDTSVLEASVSFSTSCFFFFCSQQHLINAHASIIAPHRLDNAGSAAAAASPFVIRRSRSVPINLPPLVSLMCEIKSNLNRHFLGKAVEKLSPRLSCLQPYLCMAVFWLLSLQLLSVCT